MLGQVKLEGLIMPAVPIRGRHCEAQWGVVIPSELCAGCKNGQVTAVPPSCLLRVIGRSPVLTNHDRL